MKKIYLIVIAIIISQCAFAQLTTPPNGGNKKASVTERIGLTDVTIHYDRPAVKGREGKIWGELVPYGFNNFGFGTSKAAPWRAGANENTTIQFANDVMVEGKALPAGTYSLFVAMEKDAATVIFNKNTKAWGSFFYDEKLDALRVPVKTAALNESVEWLKYEFMDQTENSAVIALLWEKMKIPFKVEVDYINTQLASFRTELTSFSGFRWESWAEAANFCVEHHTNLDEALVWSNYAVSGPFIGQKNFRTLQTKAAVLEEMGKTADANAAMKEATTVASMQELHNYARQLLREKKAQEALDIFKKNAQKNPNVFTTNMGLMRGYAANKDYKSALKYAKAAKPQAPDQPNKEAIDGYISKLEQGKDIN